MAQYTQSGTRLEPRWKSLWKIRTPGRLSRQGSSLGSAAAMQVDVLYAIENTVDMATRPTPSKLHQNWAGTYEPHRILHNSSAPAFAKSY